MRIYRIDPGRVAMIHRSGEDLSVLALWPTHEKYKLGRGWPDAPGIYPIYETDSGVRCIIPEVTR